MTPASTTATADTLTFSWVDFRQDLTELGLVGYRIDIASDQNFEDISDSKFVTTARYTPTTVTAFPAGTYYWRVRAVDEQGITYAATDTAQFERGGPEVENHNWIPSFDSSPVLHAYSDDKVATYEFELYEGWNDPANLIHLATSYQSAFRAPLALAAGDYVWRMRGIDAAGIAGPWILDQHISIQGTETTAPLAPGSSVTNDDVVFEWADIEAPGYLVELSSESDFYTVAQSATTVMSSWAPTSSIANGTWYWRVRPLDLAGVPQGDGSTFETFAKGILPSVPTSVTSSASAGAITVGWAAPTTAGTPIRTGYRVIAQPAGIVKDVGPGITSTTIAGLLNGTSHTITVQAISPLGEGPAATKTATPNGCAGTPFSDVTTSCTEIAWVYSSGITHGTTNPSTGVITYSPTTATTRQSAAAFLYRLAGAPNGPTPTCSSQTFSDVPIAHPFCGEIKWMVDAGITTGYVDGTFLPGSSLTNQSTAVFVHRFAGSPSSTCTTAPFTDVPTSHQFCSQIKWIKSEGIDTGTGGAFSPSATANRAKFAVYLQRYAT